MRSSFSRGTLPFAALVLALLLHVCLLTPASAAKTVIPVTSGVTLSGQIIDGSMYNVGAMTSSSSTSQNFITQCTVQGDGIGFTGFTSSVSSSSIPVFNLTMAQTTVNNASIFVSGYYPPYSILRISSTTATMLGTTPLYNFQNLVPENHVVVYILTTTVTWDKDGAGGAVMFLGGLNRQLLQSYSGFYMVDTHAMYAAHMLHQGLPQCTYSLGYCLDVYNGLIAIDVATCIDCKGTFLQGDQSLRFFAGSRGGVFRISNVTATGGQAFLYSPSKNAMEISDYGNTMLYGITTDGNFFANSATYTVAKYTAYYSFMHINIVAMGSTILSPVPEAIPDAVWTGNVTLGGKLMTSVADLTANYVKTFYFLDAYGKVVEKSGSPLYSETIGQPASVFCARTKFSSASWEVLTGWQRPQCNCKGTTYGPYCMEVMDPVAYYVNYNAKDAPTVCNVDNCTTCMTMTTDECMKCDPGFMLYASASLKVTCVPNVCGECNSTDGKIYTYTGGECVENNVTNCASVNINGTCVVCNATYSLYNDKCVKCEVENCVVCSAENVCSQCSTDQAYTLVSGKCSYCGDACQTCGTGSTCAACSSGYTLSNGQCTSLCSISGCTTCSTDTKCGTCDSGLTLTSDGSCSCGIANCKSCFKSRCKECAYGYDYNINTNTCDLVAGDGSEVTRLTTALVLLFAILLV